MIRGHMKKGLAVVAYLLAWGISIGLSLLDWIVIRNLILTTMNQYFAMIPTAVRVEKRIFPHLIISAVDRILILLLGIILFILIFLIENRYRQASANGRLAQQFLYVTIIQLSILGMSILLTSLLS